MTYVLVAVALLVTSALGALLPARRAMRVDPAHALRNVSRSILPGFMIPSGSSAALIVRMTLERFAVFALEELHLAEADAVLARAGAAHRERAFDEPRRQALRLLDVGLGSPD